VLVVSDTSPLTALMQIDRADLLPLLFDRIVIPPAVRAELLREHSTLPTWLETLAPIAIPASLASAQLDLGETEALALALEIRADAVLLDERLGRRVARTLGLRVTGLLGTLILAKERGHLAAVKPVITDLRVRAGCWFDDALIADVCRAAGEV
jgi:hypothetical protein